MTDFEGFGELADELNTFSERLLLAAELLPRAIDSGVETTARDVEALASELAPKETNRLANSIHSQRQSQMHWSVGTNVHYADDVEFGTAPHVITPDGAEALKFPDGNGNVIFRSKVDHPGTPAQPFMRPALQQHQSALVENIQEAMTELFNAVLT